MKGEDLKICFSERVRFSDQDLVLGADLWKAFQDRDHDKLRELSITESTNFPFLTDVCDAEIEKETRPKQILRDLRRSGVEDFGGVFVAFRERAGVYGFGDTQVKRLLREI
jgi:hypothetical protein